MNHEQKNYRYGAVVFGIAAGLLGFAYFFRSDLGETNRMLTAWLALLSALVAGLMLYKFLRIK